MISLKDASLREIILKQLAFDNSNEDCQAIIRSIREQGGVVEYLKACRNVGTIQHKAKIATLETLNVSQKSKVKCFNCASQDTCGSRITCLDKQVFLLTKEGLLKLSPLGSAQDVKRGIIG